jgi:excisionase family DNA binding protein
MESSGVDASLLTLRQAAERTGLSATTLRRYIKSGRLRARLIPGRYGQEYVVDEADLASAGVPAKHADGASTSASGENDTLAEGASAAVSSEAFAPASPATTSPTASPPRAASSADSATSSNGIVSASNPSAGGLSHVNGHEMPDAVPGMLYRELLMKHEQLLVQYGAMRVGGQQLYEVRREAERKARQANEAVSKLERQRVRHAKEIGLLKSQVRQARLEVAEKEEELQRLRARVAQLEMGERNAARVEAIENRFLEALRSTASAPTAADAPSAPRPLRPVPVRDH